MTKIQKDTLALIVLVIAFSLVIVFGYKKQFIGKTGAIIASLFAIFLLLVFLEKTNLYKQIFS